MIEPWKWYQWVWSGLPILLLFLGGALGAITGMIGFSISLKIFRSELNQVLKYVIVGIVSLSAMVVYLVLALSLTMLIRR